MESHMARHKPLVLLALGALIIFLIGSAHLPIQEVEAIERALQPSMVFDTTSDAVYVAWSGRRGDGDYDIWLVRGGLLSGEWAFTEPLRVNDDSSRNHQWAPAMALVGPSRLILVWEDERNQASGVRTDLGDVFGAEVAWDDGSLEVGPNIRINGNGSLALPLQPSIVAGGDGRLYIAWSEQVDFQRAIRIVRGEVMNTQQDFETTTFATDNSNCIRRTPLLLWDSDLNVLDAVWVENCIGQEQIIVATLNGEGTVSRGRADSFASSRKWAPAVTVDSAGHIYVAWSDDRRGIRPGGSGDTFVARGSRQGHRWEFQAEELFGTRDPGLTGWQPSLAVSGERVLLLWTVGHIRDAMYGPVLDGTYLSLAALRSEDAGDATVQTVELHPPVNAWWSQPHMVAAGDSSLILVWVSSVDRESFLLISYVRFVSDTIVIAPAISVLRAN